jgi:hypothetical protein
MKRRKLIRCEGSILRPLGAAGLLIAGAGAFVLLCAVFTGCPTDPGGVPGGFGYINAAVMKDETKYFSLSTGEEVDADQADTTNWDIAFHRKEYLFRLIFTNGGDTAGGLNSGGQCKIYYTEKTNFDEVRLSDKIAFPGYDEDTAKYVAAMGPAEKVSLNVMTYVGYGAGNGSSNIAPFTSPFKYNQKQFYTSPEMGEYQLTNRVYIITHADGLTNSKIQINYEYDTVTPADVYLVRFEELD